MTFPLLRPASEDDDGALRALHVATWSPQISPAPLSAADAPFFTAQLRPEDVLVAAVDGELAGWIRSGPRLPLPANSHQLEIKGLAVDPDRARQGIATALVGEVADRARAAGLRRLTLRVLATNSPARALYERLGFEVEGVLPDAFLLDGAYVDDVLMGLDL